MNYLELNDLIHELFGLKWFDFQNGQHNAYKWPFWEHIIDHIYKTGDVSSLKCSGKQDLTMPFCTRFIKCSFMTQFFCGIDIT